MEGKSHGSEYQEQPRQFPEGIKSFRVIPVDEELITEGTPTGDDRGATILPEGASKDAAQHYNDFLEASGLDGFFDKKEVPGQEG